MSELEQFKAERNAAFLSMDEKAIRKYFKKWNGREMPTQPEVFWGSIHKAITGCLDLPIEFRRQSKAWLTARGWGSLDDGDL